MSEAEKLKEAKKFMEIASKIKLQEWKAMTGTLGSLKDIVDSGGMEGMFDRLAENWSLQVEDALSPLTNEISQAVSDALAPIMPEIQATLNEATDWIKIGVGSWKAVFTNEWDEVFEDINAKMPDWMKDFKNMFREWLYDLQQGVGAEFEEATSGRLTDIETWGNDVNQWWYELWISLGWY